MKLLDEYLEGGLEGVDVAEGRKCDQEGCTNERKISQTRIASNGDPHRDLSPG
jgi:hypothetical protein